MDDHSYRCEAIKKIIAEIRNGPVIELAEAKEMGLSLDRMLESKLSQARQLEGEVFRACVKLYNDKLKLV